MKLYTDGACSPNPGTGGWAAIFILDENTLVKAFGYQEETTNNAMEITSVLEGLKRVKSYSRAVDIYTDSQYVVNTMTKGWKRNKNIELWNQLDEVLKEFCYVTWNWVKGHESNQYNNMCDELAVKARTERISG